jgi:hypothetical protein
MAQDIQWGAHNYSAKQDPLHLGNPLKHRSPLEPIRLRLISSVTHKRREVFDQLRAYQLLKKDNFNVYETSYES